MAPLLNDREKLELRQAVAQNREEFTKQMDKAVSEFRRITYWQSMGRNRERRTTMRRSIFTIMEDEMDRRENQTDGINPSFDWYDQCGLKPSNWNEVEAEPEINLRIESSPEDKLKKSWVILCFGAAVLFALASLADDKSMVPLKLSIVFGCLGSLIQAVR